jgi:hypothetical protein
MLGGRNFRIQVLSASRSFAQATQILNYRNREKDFLACKGGVETRPSSFNAILDEVTVGRH